MSHITMYIAMPDLFLPVFGSETIIYKNESIDILTHFSYFFVKKMRKHPPDINISETCIDANLKMLERRDPDNFPRFAPQE